METKQTTKAVMALWTEAMTSHNAGNYVRSLEKYGQIEDKSCRMFYNMGCANIKLNRGDEALKCFTKSVEKDPNSAISFFQRGVLYLREKCLEESMSDFITTHTLLRGNTFINYKQLGMRCKLHLCEILYNMALIHVIKGDNSRAERLLVDCQLELEYKHRHLISMARNYIQGNGVTLDQLNLRTISPDLIFSPPKDVIANLNKKSVMGKAKVVSSTDLEDLEPRFNGLKRVEELKTAALQKSLQTPTSPLMAVRRFLKNPGAKRDRSKSQDQTGMKASLSMSDLRARPKSEEVFSESLPAEMFRNLRNKPSSTLDIRRSSSAIQLSEHQGKRISAGSIFGNTLSPVNRALSSSFDILTAIVVPSEEESDPGYENLPNGQNSYDSYSREVSHENDVTDVFIDLSNIGKPPTQTCKTNTPEQGTGDLEKPKCVFTFGEIEKYSSTKRDSAHEKVNNDNNIPKNEVILRSLGGGSPRSRKIPPPPSYPPPPLPPNVVKLV